MYLTSSRKGERTIPSTELRNCEDVFLADFAKQFPEGPAGDEIYILLPKKYSRGEACALEDLVVITIENRCGFYGSTIRRHWHVKRDGHEYLLECRDFDGVFPIALPLLAATQMPNK